MRHFARYVILAPLAAALAVPAAAQTIPAGQTCGGLLCDIGMIGHRSPVAADGQPVYETPAQIAAIQEADPHHLACHDFLCHAFGQARADEGQAPAPEAVAVAPETPVAPAHKAKRRHVAKAAATESAN